MATLPPHFSMCQYSLGLGSAVGRAESRTQPKTCSRLGLSRLAAEPTPKKVVGGVILATSKGFTK